MPFTPTHILAVVPLSVAFRWMPWSALAIGSMIPDFPVFVPISPDYGITHSATGLFTACLPLGLAAFFLFQCFIKVPVLSLMPTGVQRRLTDCSRPIVSASWTSLAAISASIVLGAGTHIVWDAFTHAGRWGTQAFPILNSSAVWGGISIPGYKLFQYGSTFVGLPALALLAAVWLRGAPPRPNDDLFPFSRTSKFWAWCVAATIPAIVTAAVFSTIERGFYSNIGIAIRASGLALMIFVAAFTILFHVRTRGQYIPR